MNRLADLLVLAAACVAGCVTGHNFSFPSDISPMCYGERNAAHDCIVSLGVDLKTKDGCTLARHPGERKFGSMWCWQSPEWQGMWVGGLCWGTRIEVGCHPQTGGEIMTEVVRHEFGHYWLITNYSDYRHDAKYSTCFYNWCDPRLPLVTGGIIVFDIGAKDAASTKAAIRTLYDSVAKGTWLSVVEKDGGRFVRHIDFVKVD